MKTILSALLAFALLGTQAQAAPVPTIISAFPATYTIGSNYVFLVANPGVATYKSTLTTLASNLNGLITVTATVTNSVSRGENLAITNANSFGVFYQISGLTNMQFFNLKQGTNIVLYSDGSNIVLNATGGDVTTTQLNTASNTVVTMLIANDTTTSNGLFSAETTRNSAVSNAVVTLFIANDTITSNGLYGIETTRNAAVSNALVTLIGSGNATNAVTLGENLALTNSGRMGVFYQIQGVTNIQFRTVSAGNGLVSTNLGTNIVTAIDQAIVASHTDLTTASNTLYTTETTRNGAVSNAVVAEIITASNTLRTVLVGALTNKIESLNGVGTNLNLRAVAGAGLALTVDTNVLVVTGGNVGIGIATPADKLSVAFIDTNVYSSTANVGEGMKLDNTNSSAFDGTFSTIEMSTTANGAQTAIGIINLIQPTATSRASDMAVQLRTVGNTYIEAIRLKSDGSVGIGTTTPVSALDVPGEGRFGSLKATGAVVFAAASSVGQVPTFRSDGTLYPSNVVATASGTNFPPVTTSGTNITVGTGVRKSLLMPTNASVGISFNGTEILGETLTLVVTNTSATASNLTINFFQDSAASSFFDATVASNVTGFLVVSNSSKKMEFVYNGTFWRLESTLVKEMELAVAGGLSLQTNSASSIVTLSNSLAIQQLNNVGVGTPANGHILSWNATMGVWTNGVVPGGDVVSNITVSATNNVLLDFGAANVFKLTLLTNWTETFTNVTLLTKRGYVYYQQDTNGGRILNNYYVNGGFLQTNATENMQPTTNANALDLLELMPGFFTTNLMAFWPQDFQPRIKFTNSLHAFLSFMDTFNRSNADPMSTTASDGNTWTSGPGALADPRIVSAMLFGNAGETGCRVLTPTLAGNHVASLTLLNNIGHIGPMVRMQSASDASGYMLVAGDATHLTIYKITDTGTLAYAVLLTTGETPAMVAGDIITLSANGTTLEAFLNGVSYGSVVDATFSGGQPGIWTDSDIASGGPFTASEQ